MPRHRRRRGLPRFLLPAALGAIVLGAVWLVVGGAAVSPTSAGAVAGVQVASSQRSGDPSVARPGTIVTRDPVSGSPLSATTAHGDASRPAPVKRAPAPRPRDLSRLTGYQWPLPHGRITLPFGPSEWGSRVVDAEPFHDGLDLATFCGDRIVAAHDGVVLAAGRRYDHVMGWIGDLQAYRDRLDAKGLWSTLPIVVVIDDGNGYRSIYAHLSEAAVKKGETVSAGDLIGYEGATGRASGCHLHYGLFSPQETARFGIEQGVVERMQLPAWQIARVDPLAVLPERPDAGPARGSAAGAAKPSIE